MDGRRRVRAPWREDRSTEGAEGGKVWGGGQKNVFEFGSPNGDFWCTAVSSRKAVSQNTQ